MRLAKIFRAARIGRVLRFTSLTLFARFLWAWSAWGALVALIAAAATLVALFAGTVGGAFVKLAQCAAEIFDLAFVGEFLAFGHFDEFQDFFHLINRAFEDFDDGHDFINRLVNG